MQLKTLHILAVSVLAFSEANAQIYVIDQQNDPEPITQKDAVAAVTPGQTFVPTLDGIGFADFLLNNFSGVTGEVSAELLGGINGAIIGASDVVDIPGDNTFSYYRFLFPSQITLTPGQTYALEVGQVGGGTVWICHQLADTYSEGTAFWASADLPQNWNFDYNFAEGIVVVPEPAVWGLISLGVVASLSSRRSRGGFINVLRSLRRLTSA
jgi:hypothetical protein